jgi:hypothetical protein
MKVDIPPWDLSQKRSKINQSKCKVKFTFAKCKCKIKKKQRNSK